MNLHITGDDKFIDFFIGDIEKMELTTSNDFVVYVREGRDLKYVKSKRIHKMTLNSAEWNIFFKENLEKYERVFIHYFDGLLYDIIPLLPSNVKVIWCFYGNDGFLYFPENYFLQKLTRRLSLAISDRRRGIPFKVFYPLFLLNRKIFLFTRRVKMRSAFRRVDYFANFLTSDFHLIRKKVGLQFKHVEVTLASLETIISMEASSQEQDQISFGNSILIGNSATITNNHLDLFERLLTQDTKGRKIYCPLSYGNENYADIIQERGREMFGANFIPLVNFMKLDDYNAILKDCGYVFMNHDRTQGAGNIIVSLYNGAKVFLSNQSGIYHFLVNLGVKVFSIQDDITVGDSIFVPLAETEVLLNRKLIFDYFNSEKHEKRLLTVLNV
ncbi:MAG: TDP-N-acetylfucosamine:lipid II N-acetylfucosaminyltransferase [Ferruginibacter sp.]